jgi:hypothetical protein
MKLDGIHGIKIGDVLCQLVLASPAEAIKLAQRIAPVKGTEKISIVPVVVAEKKESRR